MLFNTYTSGQFRLQLVARVGLVFFLWLMCLAYQDFSPNETIVYSVDKYFTFYLAYSALGLFFLLKFINLLFVVWRFFLDLFLCYFWISFPLEISTGNDWNSFSYIFSTVLLLYISVYFMRFIFWRKFESSLLKYGKLKITSEGTKFYICPNGYEEIYEINSNVYWLKNFCFWERGFFSKEVNLGEKKSSNFVMYILYFIAAASLLVMMVSNFDIYGLVTVIVTTLMLPQLMRVSVGPAFLDLVLSLKFKQGDIAEF
ncbi:hypothetical protein PSECIP111951_04163 [Pseudoalteromonas holothuriae]|uniref:Uncharacterized protein n=1 Tax=Pseudoalteromonas holothuriae TaxID=2963714 RepID=A0ABM9GNQ5_9GAMM|nr:hypothetical protein [Pseudoalteromonas sp. CIP111951]CAH9068482.1 hypothetical protein PSECIP111951_04163 [Pseudoalteromonas sp. CIP111951]